MTENLDALLRRHYRAAAGEIHADAAAVRRFRDAGHAAAHARPGVLRRWAFPALAAAVTAAVLVAVAVLFWPGGRGSEPPRPMAPPATPLPPPASPTPVPEAPAPDRTSSPGEDPTASPGERSPAGTPTATPPTATSPTATSPTATSSPTAAPPTARPSPGLPGSGLPG
ncbi:hypothetical protein [Actinomadura sp.]|uniref:hypothetical protein n=1 Tax=Actinomadura sp. TaxID=1989 RepID=UPI0037C565B5